MRRSWLLLLALHAPLASAEIFKCTDADGQVTYTNSRQKGCTAMDIGPYREPAKGTAKSRGGAPQSQTPAGFPSVDPATQKRRDQGRRQILERELMNEEKLLADARRFLAEGEIVKVGEDRGSAGYTDRVRKLGESVRVHEQNVAALKRELANVK